MKVRVSIINYSNTIPFVYGLLHNSELQNQSEFLYHYPAQGVELLAEDKVDICIVPIAAIPQIPNAQIISNFCIGTFKEVKSVLLCSNTPVSEITHITLDYQSLSSNMLTKILAQEVWKISPQYSMGTEGYETSHDSSAKVIIGDRAMDLAHTFAYTYDLALEWNNAFGYPFVFACWIANKPIAKEYISLFESALQFGVEHIDDAITWANKPVSFDMQSYLKTNIDYRLTDDKRKSMELFYEKIQLIK